MKGFDETMQDLLDLVDEENLVVTTAVVQVEDEEYGGLEEVQAARVEYDGEVRGVITYDGMEAALEAAAGQMYDALEEGEDEEGHFDVSTRHIASLQAMVNELGFDRAVALLERLNK